MDIVIKSIGLKGGGPQCARVVNCSPNIWTIRNESKGFAPGPMELGGRVWQLPYKYLRNLISSATVCHTNILEIHFDLPHQCFSASNGPVHTQYLCRSLWIAHPILDSRHCTIMGWFSSAHPIFTHFVSSVKIFMVFDFQLWVLVIQCEQRETIPLWNNTDLGMVELFTYATPLREWTFNFINRLPSKCTYLLSFICLYFQYFPYSCFTIFKAAPVLLFCSMCNLFVLLSGFE